MLGHAIDSGKQLVISILLLVSDPLVRSVMQETLEREGFVIFPAAELGTAADYLKHSTPDLLITRTYISGMPGHEAAMYLRNACPGMRVLMVGGLLDDDRLRYREELEGFDIFPPPFTKAQFIDKVRGVLAQAG
jgi:DNA-binding response OmpR family regulator